jgi:hypothetical protein
MGGLPSFLPFPLFRRRIDRGVDALPEMPSIDAPAAFMYH